MYQKEAELVVRPPSATIVPMSPQPGIPSWVALQQSPRPLRRPQQASRTILLLYAAQQRNEICPCFPCLNRRVHSGRAKPLMRNPQTIRRSNDPSNETTRAVTTRAVTTHER